MSDAATILDAEEANRTDYHWLVGFMVRLHPSAIQPIERDATGAPRCPDCGDELDEDQMTKVTGSITVACGDDGMVAIDRVKTHVLDETKFGAKVMPESFRLMGLKLLSAREL